MMQTSMQINDLLFGPCKTVTHPHLYRSVLVWGSHSIVYEFTIACVLANGISSLIEALWVGGGFAVVSVSILFPAPLFHFSPISLSLFVPLCGCESTCIYNLHLLFFSSRVPQIIEVPQIFPFYESLHVPSAPLHPCDFSCFHCLFSVQWCGVFPVSARVWLDSVSVSALFNQHVNKKGN